MLNKEQLIQMEPRLGQAAYFVEASNDEQYFLWEANAENSQYAHHQTKIKWQQHSGTLLTIGHLSLLNDGKIAIVPVCIQCMFNTLDGHLVCFYGPTSQYVDHNMIEDAIKPFVKQTEDHRPCKCNVANFHHCIHHLKDLNK